MVRVDRPGREIPPDLAVRWLLMPLQLHLVPLVPGVLPVLVVPEYHQTPEDHQVLPPPRLLDPLWVLELPDLQLSQVSLQVQWIL